MGDFKWFYNFTNSTTVDITSVYNFLLLQWTHVNHFKLLKFLTKKQPYMYNYYVCLSWLQIFTKFILKDVQHWFLRDFKAEYFIFSRFGFFWQLTCSLVLRLVPNVCVILHWSCTVGNTLIFLFFCERKSTSSYPYWSTHHEPAK